LAIPRASCPFFLFCASEHIFGRTESVGSRFLILGALTRFRRKRGCRIPFSCFALPESFSAVPRASGFVFKFCTPGHVFGGTAGIGSRFLVLGPLTRFRQKQGCQVSFSCFAPPNSFWAVPRASCLIFKFCAPDSFSAVPRVSAPVFMFCPPGLVFDGTEGVVSRFHVLRAKTHFRRYRGRRVPFSCFARPDSFLAETRVPGTIFMFCASEFVSRGTEGIGSRFQVLHSRTRFRRYRGHRVPISCFALPNSFSAVIRASGPVYMLCAPRLIFDSTEGVGSCFLVMRSQTHFRRY
jgi:hypothetical protein